MKIAELPSGPLAGCAARRGPLQALRDLPPYDLDARSRAAGQFDTPGVFAVLFIMVVMGYGSYEVIRLLEERAFPWKRSFSASEPMEG